MKEQLESLRRELSEAREQQAATADVLKAISRSTFQLQTVLETLCEAATRLCEAEMVGITRQVGANHFQVANFGYPPHFSAYTKNLPMVRGKDSAIGRVLLEKGVVHIPDCLADPDYAQQEAQKIGGFRTLLGVPLLREGNPIGVIVLLRRAVRPFSPRHVELASTFADQALIAIENTRLFEEVQARTKELQVSLDYQTATSEVLGVISRSQTDVRPVFGAIIDCAVRLCGADQGGILKVENGQLDIIDYIPNTPEFWAVIRQYYPRPVDTTSLMGRTVVEARVIHVPDLEAPTVRTQLSPLAKQLGFRSQLSVPILRGGQPIGLLALQRRAPGPFSPAQIELVETFADQAVIAIENASLFDEVQEKTRQLELANTYKSRFLAAASHDLRQPLHALNLFIAQLRAEEDATERSRLQGRIDAAIGSMNELFEALLDMSRLDAGVLEPNLADFPIDRLLKRMETTFTDTARKKGLRFRVVPSRCWVRSDFILLERILLNLGSNAIRYTAHGGVVIGCRRRGDQLRVEVVDSGPGIARDQQRNVFDEFYQLPDVGRDRLGGMGLGLSIVDRLGRLLEHPVELTSHPGKGSRFAVTVPLAPFVATPETVSPPDNVAGLLTGKRIMVIDDDPLALDGMRGILVSWGCQVVSATSTQTALIQLAKERTYPDLIISDYHLADGEIGIELVARLRAAVGAEVPAFFISGDTSPDRLQHTRASGYHLLHKPVSLITLRAMVNSMLMARDSRLNNKQPN